MIIVRRVSFKDANIQMSKNKIYFKILYKYVFDRQINTTKFLKI